VSGSDRDAGGAAMIPLVDTHVHFFDHSVPGLTWAWLDPSFQQFGETHRLDAPRFTTPELRQEIEGAGLGGMVHVNATTPLADPSAETEWLDHMADEHGWPNAMIGACALNAPDAPEVLRNHRRWSRLRGVRDLGFAHHPDPATVGAALDAATDLGLCIELRTPVQQLDDIGTVATRWPSATFLLSHAGLPYERNPDSFREWRAAIGALASRGNIVCKISAVGGSSDRNWSIESIRPWVLGCIEAFGPDRCMFGTNWPLDRLWSPYVRLVEAYRQVIADLDRSSQHGVLHGTAERVFGFSL
jgi:predicted TIM-barrel fold metal-dependent hydrolase